jgi:ubiquinone/menaquinone biosynthesis C-methylase UbiE
MLIERHNGDMMKLRSRFDEFIGRQQRCPSGIVGQVIGARMVRQHAAETLWTVSLLGIQPTDSILEIGFGAGRAIELAVVQAPNGHITGIDLSQAMVRAASRRNARAIQAGRVTLHRGDATTLPFAAAQFDKILSIHTFYFWSDPLHTLSEIFRVLKPGGRVALTLSTGKEDAMEATGLERYQDMLEEEVIPHMQRLGFAQAFLQAGPTARQFKSVAIVGVK